ncbi:MAG: ATP-dependent Clp protease ATP-binding subunit [Candidatus Muirbacterium halophilum]|nr:ATP-dependent Clp protease ATP-binding subunit [Candidatus Muirbacterium halophilum]
MANIKLFEEFDDSVNEPLVDKKTNNNQSSTPMLDYLGTDLTKLAKEGKIEPVIGREYEIDQLVWVLSRKTKNNPVLIGEPGTGKSHIVGGVALKIANDEIPVLENKRLISLDVTSLTSGAGGQGDLQQRVKALLNELANNKDVILFIDELHMLMAAKSGEMGVADMLKPALARGEMRCIGATTLKEYKMIEKDGALARRFNSVTLTVLSIADTIKILNGIKYIYEDFHNVEYTDEAIESCVKLSDRYVTDRYFPDKAIDLMDEVGAKIRIEKSGPKDPEIKNKEKKLLELRNEFDLLMDESEFDEASKVRIKIKELENELKDVVVETIKVKINKSDVERIVSIKTGIPVDKLDKNKNTKILGLSKELKSVVIGQDEAIDKIAKTVIRTHAGLKDPNRPNSVFLLLGEPATGKTHTVKQLAKQLYGSENNMIRIDMSEYQAPHNVARMIGSPPGYIGHGEGGQLTEKVKRKPNSVILFDEIEKAHPDVLDIMLQIFEDGKLTDGEGVTIDFRNTYIFMTSNIGSRQIKKIVEKPAFGFSEIKPEEKTIEIKNDIKEELSKQLKPEFISRIDEIIIFATLTKDNLYQIVDIEVNKLKKRIEELGFTMNITDNVKELLIDKSGGARDLRNSIRTYLENPISMEIMKKNITDKIEVDYDKKADKIIINGEMFNENKIYIKKFNIFNLFS